MASSGGLRYRQVPQSESDTQHAQRSTRFSKAKQIVRKLDVYPKLQEDFKVKTSSGALVSIIVGGLMLLLFLSELYHYLSPKLEQHIVVDTSFGEKLRINFDITYPSLQCKEVHVDTMDIVGDVQVDNRKNIYRERISPGGIPMTPDTDNKQPATFPPDYCGSCMGAAMAADSGCCNSCQELKAAYMALGWSTEEVEQIAEQCTHERAEFAMQSQEGEGCRVFGFVMMNKAGGNLHIALGESYKRDGYLVHQFSGERLLNFNASHRINSFSFGTPFPGMVNPLDGVEKSFQEAGSAVYQYYVKVVPTIYEDQQESFRTNQYSYTERTQFIRNKGEFRSTLPGTFFVFEPSPFVVNVKYSKVPLGHFLTNVCAITGGLFTVAGLIDSFIYHSQRKRAAT